MVGSGNPPAVYVQVIIGCVTARAGLWHRELRLPVFFCENPAIQQFFSDNFMNCPLNPQNKWFIMGRSIFKKDAQSI